MQQCSSRYYNFYLSSILSKYCPLSFDVTSFQPYNSPSLVPLSYSTLSITVLFNHSYKRWCFPCLEQYSIDAPLLMLKGKHGGTNILSVPSLLPFEALIIRFFPKLSYKTWVQTTGLIDCSLFKLSNRCNVLLLEALFFTYPTFT